MATIRYSPPPTIKKFIQHYTPGELFYSWIVGPFGCLPADSEFLTPNGWKRMDAYAPGDLVAVSTPEGVVAFEPATRVKLPATEPFYRFDSGSLEMELSPEHTVLYTDYRGVRQTATAAECAAAPSRRTIPTTFVLDRPDALIDDCFIRLRVAFSADGHIPAAGKRVVVTVRKERKKTRLRELLMACSIRWTEATYATRPTETIFKFEWRGADKSLGFVWGLSSDQLTVVVDECLRWDGLNEHTEKRYFSTVRANADAIQFAAHACGYRATIKAVDDRRHPEWATCYTVAIRASDNAKNKAMIRAETRITRREAEDGHKYCFTTSTGYFVARCNGKVFITGNSGKTTANFFKLVTMAKQQEPSKDGIRRTRAVIIRNTMPQLKDTTLMSWSYWFKDGQAGSWKETDKTFTLRFDDVECIVLFRALDTEQDVARVLSLEINFAIIDEFVEIPRKIVEALSARVGRYKLPDGTKPTSWGMWGSSNPSTEDNWWYDYLHRQCADPDQNMPESGEYFVQPSGFSPDAENLENLPGGRAYYENQAKGKSEAWVKQFLEAEWGYSISGKPVVASFKPELHLAKKPLKFNPYWPLIIGLDPGLGGSAMIFMQETPWGCLNVLGELVQSGIGAERLIRERLLPYLRRRFPDAEVVIAPDPDANKRTQTDERTVVSFFIKQFGAGRVKIETNNRLALRLDAIEHYTTKLVEGGPALQIDIKECPVLTRALKGGWRWELDPKRGDSIRTAEPDKRNPYSHPGDAFGYGCRYFHRMTERSSRETQVRARSRQSRLLRSPYHIQ